MQAMEIETKRRDAMASGVLDGSGDSKPKYLDQIDTIAALMEQDNMSKNATLDEMREKYDSRGGKYEYTKEEIAGAYYKYTGNTDCLNEINYQKILLEDGRPVIQKDIKDDEVKNHAHHICYKQGRKGVVNDITMEGHKILRRYDIDPVLDPHNLVSAPNTGHSEKNIQEVVDALKEAEQDALIDCEGDGLTGEERKEYVKQKLYDRLNQLGRAEESKSNKKRGKGKNHDRANE